MDKPRLRPLSECQLYTFVDTAYLRGRDPKDIARALCDGGSDLIQLRAKGASVREVSALALELLPITSAAGVSLVINDHLQIATEVGAPVCHLGQEDFFDAGHTHIRDLNAPGHLQIGLSTHAPAQAARAIAAGAAYIAIGPIYATDTKPGAKPVTLEYVRWAAANIQTPWFAIGGVNERTLDDILAAGATRICVVSAILNAPDLSKACAQFKKRLPGPVRP